ncbi:undecaprenyl-diphosphate phosphatase [soil metagenome]
MDQLIKAIVLGIIQGLTEFIPISSSAHLRIIPALLGWQDMGSAFTAVIQLGTLIATFVYFRKDIKALIKGFILALKRKDFFVNPESRIFLLLILGTIPIAVFGLVFKKFITGPARGLYVISASMIILAIVLYIAEKVSRKEKAMKDISIMDGVAIGFAQVLALIPGVSRSGSTITAGLFRGLKRDVAARYSFLLSIPAISLSGLYELYSERAELLHSNLVMLVVATIVSGIVGYLSIAFLINYLKKHSNMIFVIYRIIFGIVILLLVIYGVLPNIDPFMK